VVIKPVRLAISLSSSQAPRLLARSFGWR